MEYVSTIFIISRALKQYTPLNFLFQIHYAQAWGNINLFDFNNRLRSDKVSLHLWPMPQGHDDMLYPIGIPGRVI